MTKIKWGLLSFTLLFLLTGCSFADAPEESDALEDFAALYSNWEAEIETVPQEEEENDTDETDDYWIKPVDDYWSDPVDDYWIDSVDDSIQEVPDNNAVSGTDSEKALSLGVLEGNVYTNRYTGYGCNFSGWTVRSSEDLQDMTEAVKDVVANSQLGDAVAAALSEYDTFYDLDAASSLGLKSVNILYRKIQPTERLVYSSLSEEEIIDILLLMEDELTSTMEQIGVTVISIDKATVEFLGEQRTAIKTVSMSDGITTYQTQIADFQLGDYSVWLSVTTYFSDSAQDVLDLFYPVD